MNELCGSRRVSYTYLQPILQPIITLFEIGTYEDAVGIVYPNICHNKFEKTYFLNTQKGVVAYALVHSTGNF